MAYNSKYTGEEVEGALDLAMTALQEVPEDYAKKEDIPTKVGQFVNNVNYISEDIPKDGVYAVTVDGTLVDYNDADNNCIGVALLTRHQKIMIAKHDATNEYENKFYWGKNLYLKDVSAIDDKKDKPEAYADYSGKINTVAIISGYTEHNVEMDSHDMCKGLETFNSTEEAIGRSDDWYIPSVGQLYDIYTNKNEINEAIAMIGGTAIETGTYWSSTEGGEAIAWYVDLHDGNAYSFTKNLRHYVRFVRDLPFKYLKDRVADLESNKQDKLISGGNIKTINGTTILGSGNITIECEVSEQTVADWGFTKNKGDYSKPADGIPKTDFESSVQSSLDKADSALQEVPEDYAKMEDIPIKVGQLINDVNYISEDIPKDGVYAVTADGSLIDYTTADSSCIGVALLSRNQKIMISKSDASNETGNSFFWGNKLLGKDVSGISNKTDAIEAKKDYNGKENTYAIISSYIEYNVEMDNRDMCKPLETYTEGSFDDWYIPAAGQIGEIYANISDINAALMMIGGTPFNVYIYWSSTESSSGTAWYVDLTDGHTYSFAKYIQCRVRFVRNIPFKTLKERMADLESNKQDKLFSGVNIKTINGQSILGKGNLTFETYMTVSRDFSDDFNDSFII